MHPFFKEVCEAQGWKVIAASAVIPLSDGRTQSVLHEVYEEDGDKILRAYTVVGDARVLDERRVRAALSLNWRLRFGAIAIWEDKLVLTDTFLVEEMDAHELLGSIKYLAETGDKYEKYLFRVDKN